MTRADLIKRLALRNPTLSERDISRLVDAIFAAIADHLAKNGRIELRGFGSFSTRLRTARAGMNPRSGASVQVKAKWMVYFRPGKQIRDHINANHGRTKVADISRPPL